MGQLIKKHFKDGINFTDKLSAAMETCEQSLWILIFVVSSVAIASLVGLFLQPMLMFIFNLILGVIGFWIGGRAIKRVRKVRKLK